MSATLSYAGRNIKWNTAVDAQSLVDDIGNTADLKCLKLEANTLGVDAAKVIGDALAAHPEFERAHWKDLFTGRLKTEIPQALKHLFSGIKRANAKLLELDLSDNALGPIGVEGMVDFIKSPSCYSLQELRLNNNGLGIKGGTMLAEALMELFDRAKEAGTPLRLKVFISGRNRLENNGAKILSKFFTMVQTLEEIAMPQNGIFHEGIAALAKSFSCNPSLRIINLNDNTFTPVGARAMAEELPNMTNLEVINFGDCLLKTDGAIAISDALRDKHEKLKELYMDSNEVGIKGGVAIIKALSNKPNLSHVMLDANQFGEDGLEEILALLQSIGKEDVLGSMEDNEEPDEEDEEEGDHSADEEATSDEEVENEEDQEATEIVSPLKKDFSIHPIQCSLCEFLNSPNAARLLGLPSEDSLIAEAKQNVQKLIKESEFTGFNTNELLIQEYINIFVNIASLSTSSNDQVIQKVSSLSKVFLKEVFTIAETSNCQSIATNSLLVHLGLLKSENKSFRIHWDLRGVLIGLVNRIEDQTLPAEAKRTLQFFLSRPGLSIDKFAQEKHKLLSALFKV